MDKIKIIGTYVLFLLLSINAFADDIYLKNGDHISGELISLFTTICTFKTPYQATLQIEREQISRLSTNKTFVIELYSSERFIGTISSGEDNIVSIHSERFGTLTVQFPEIKKIINITEELPPNSPYLNRNIPSISSKRDTSTSRQRKLSLASVSKTSHLSKKIPVELQKQGRGIKSPSNSSASNTQSNTPHVIGEKNKEDLQQLFLRNTAVLLKKGERELETAVSYSYDQSGEIRERDFTIPWTLYVGLTDRLESFINLPVTWRQQEDLSQGNYSKNHQVGLGDVSVGLNYLLASENKQWPDVIGIFGVTVPTGDEPNMLAPNKASLGSGHWDITTGLTLIKTYDPAVLYGGIDYTHTFPHTFNDGVRVSPGDSVSYWFGMGFAINDQLALFSQFIGLFQRETHYDDVKILGSAQEQMSLTTGFTYSLGKYNYLQPALTFGLNDDALDVIFDVSYIRRF